MFMHNGVQGYVDFAHQNAFAREIVHEHFQKTGVFFSKLTSCRRLSKDII